MRISRRMGLHGGKRTAVVSVYGAPNESVTLVSRKGQVYSDIALDEHGISTQTYKLPVGSYVIKGSVSRELFANGRQVDIAKETTKITAYPPGAIFWFGNGDKDGDPLYVGDYTISRGHVPSGKSGIVGDTKYSTDESDETSLGVKQSCHSTSGSDHGNTMYSPQIQLSGYSYVNIYASCTNTSRGGFGFPSEKAAKWETSMYVKPSSTDYKFYSMEIPAERTDGYLALSNFNNRAGGTTTSRVKAAWRDNTNEVPQGTIYEKKVSVPTANTYRYCNHIAGGFKTGYSLSYVGQGERVAAGEEWNAMMIPVPAFSFEGTGLRLKMAINCYSYQDKGYTYCWAVTTSRANESLYEEGCGDVTDANQIMHGTFTPAYNNGSFGYQTFTLEGGEIPSNTPLYIYLWRSVSTYGNIHVQDDVNITLQYLVE